MKTASFSRNTQPRAVLGTVALLALLVAGLQPASAEDSGETPAASAAELTSYEVLNTVEYRGQGNFSQQTSGTMVVKRQPLESGDVAYAYSFLSDVTADGGKTIGQTTLPVVTILRDPKTERIVGGDRFVKNLGLVSNAALDEIKGELPTDGTALTRGFEFDVSAEFPKKLSYRLSARRQKLTTTGEAVAVLAVSEPFEYEVPGTGMLVSGRHRVLCLLDSAKDDVFFQCSNFVAVAPEGNRVGTLRIESMMVQLRQGKPVSLDGLDDTFTWQFDLLDLSAATPGVSSDAGLPYWAMHSLAVRDMADLVAGAAIEGKPNFAICATVGLVLLVDSAVSTSTTLLHEAGVIDRHWQGIPNYLGGNVGLMAAKGTERITGKDVNEQKWKALGGLGGDVASFFIPQKALGTGIKVGSGGVKILKGQELAGKSLRISKHGVDLVRAGKGWQNSKRLYEGLKTVQTGLNLINLVRQADEIAEEYGSKPNVPSGQSPVGTPGKPGKIITNSIGMKMVLIPAGEFMMGIPDSEEDVGSNEKPQHRVRITKPFHLGVYEVTQEQYERVMGKNPSKFEGENLPVETVSWEDAQEFCGRLSVLAEEKAAGRVYRLPTEAEWEYACRAGSTTKWCFGDSEDLLKVYAWYQSNSARKTHPVGQMKPNAWGLYDMHGNVWEWCTDWYGGYQKQSPTDDPTGPKTGSDRVLRGGGWRISAWRCRSADRYGYSPGYRISDLGLGFRVALVPSE